MIRYAMSAAIVAICTASLAAQKTTTVHPGKGGSPHVRTEWTIDGANISIEYGRPYLKGRKVEDVAPHGKVWRAGADEATTIKTDKALKFGNVSVPAGTYTLFAMPGEKQWQLVISKQTGQWGTAYTEGQDLGRVPMQVGNAKSPAEQVTWSIDDTSQGGTLRLDWGTTSVSAPFTVGGQS
jgi:hypothetical protein